MIELIERPYVVLEMAKRGRSIVEDKFDVKKVNKKIMETMGL